MAELSVYIISISVLKQSLDIDKLLESRENKQKFHLERTFGVATDLSQNVVIVNAELSITVEDSGSKIELQNLEVETTFKVQNLKSHIKNDDSEDLDGPAFKALVNLAYHHVRAIQAQQLNNPELGHYLVPLLTVTDDKSIQAISHSKNKNIG